MGKVWTGIHADKEFHWAHVLDASGTQLLSLRVENDEAELVTLIEEILSLAEDVLWAVDQPGGCAALLLTLLWERGQRVIYVPGLTVDRACDAYRGESKTDAKEPRVIADQARMRSDLGVLEPGEGELAELELLLARRRDLVTDQSRTIVRLKKALLALFPALKRTLDLNRTGSSDARLSLPDSGTVRRTGYKRLATYLANRTASKVPLASPARLSPRLKPRALSYPPKMPPLASSASLPKRCSPSRTASRASKKRSGSVFSPARRRRSLLACPGWG